MTIKIAINGYGRIGRGILWAKYENHYDDIEIVAINDLAKKDILAHLTQYDTVHGKFPGEVRLEGDYMIVNGDRIFVSATKDFNEVRWGELGVDVVNECTGFFRSGPAVQPHLTEAGAKKVLISSPGQEGVDATVVFGINHSILKASDKVVSNASCTTNCLAPLAKPLVETIGINKGFLVTTHAYTNDQVLTDTPHKDMRRARSATQSIIPTKTGAASAVGLVLPELKGVLDGYAFRVPTINVSIVDLTFEAKRETSVEEINQILKTASEGELKGILTYNDLPLVSCDFNNNPASSIYDSTLTKVIGNMVKVSAWYDNECGFANRMLDVNRAMMQAK